MPLRTYAVLGALLFSGAAQAIPIDLNDFFFFPGDPVTVAPDGSSALIEELAGFSPIVLENNPAFGDPGFLIAAPEVILSFEFEFVEGPGEASLFSAIVLDDTGSSLGAGFESFVEDSLSGTQSFDLSPAVGEILGLEFALKALDANLTTGSSVLISNVRLEAAPAQVPEPTTPALVALGLLALLWRRTYGYRRH